MEKVELVLQKSYKPAQQTSYCGTEGHGYNDTVSTPEQNFSEPLRLVRELKSLLDALLQNRKGSPPEIRILKRVFFPSLYMRKESMCPADVDTFEWIFRDPIEKSAEESVKWSQEKSTEQFEEDAREKAAAAAATRCYNGSGTVMACSTSLGRQDPGNRQ